MLMKASGPVTDEDRARARAMLKRARFRMATALDLRTAFFGAMLLSLPMEEDESVGTMATDGTRILYAPSFVRDVVPDESRASPILLHEVLHVAHNHMGRMRGKDPLLWNLSCDLSINGTVMEACRYGSFTPLWQWLQGMLLPGEGPFRDLPP